MHSRARKIALQLGGLALVASACASESTAPSDAVRTLAPGAIHADLASTYDAGDSRLSASIWFREGNKFPQGHDGYYWAHFNVSGGTPPYQKTLFLQYCNYGYSPMMPSDCSELNEWVTTTADSVLLEIHSDFWRYRFVAHVMDAQGYAMSGAANKVMVGPAGPGASENDSGMSCAYDAPADWYPVQAFNGKHYRRNGCTGGRDYNPNGS
jgi:hypothetical protein